MLRAQWLERSTRECGAGRVWMRTHPLLVPVSKYSPEALQRKEILSQPSVQIVKVPYKEIALFTFLNL